MGVIVSLASPRLSRSFKGLSADNFAYDLARLTTTLGERAVAEGNVYRLAFDEDRTAYWTERAPGGLVPGETSSFKKVKDRYGMVRRVPAGVTVEAQGEAPTFFPSGEQSPFTLTILENGNPFYVLSSEGVYGYTRLEEVGPEGVEP